MPNRLERCIFAICAVLTACGCFALGIAATVFVVSQPTGGGAKHERRAGGAERENQDLRSEVFEQSDLLEAIKILEAAEEGSSDEGSYEYLALLIRALARSIQDGTAFPLPEKRSEYTETWRELYRGPVK